MNSRQTFNIFIILVLSTLIRYIFPVIKFIITGCTFTGTHIPYYIHPDSYYYASYFNNLSILFYILFLVGLIFFYLTCIKLGIRKRISGTESRPRLTVFRSNAGIYAQLIDDDKAVTLVSASSREVNKEANSTNVAVSTQVGEILAKKAKEKGIEQVVFDRNGYLYHGKVKALAEGARKGGLQF
jgi:large subunit ribosomal protein L18